MRIDGFSPAYVPNRTTRPDTSAQMDDAVRQAESRMRQQQPANATDSLRLDTPQAVQRPSAQIQIQQYEARQALNNPAQQYQASKALASYSTTAAFSHKAEEAATVLGLDLYA
ncbi:MAG: hypothetical protein GX673_09225 [Gammaproteobacteria bacterium]|nr:hypothetical protein [Gammaproteobacteria bacterium]HKM26951.1 hypothetical protein [Thiopseudomonas sp.]